LGQVVGQGTTPADVTRGFLYTPQLGLREIGTFGGSFSEAKAINNTGTVAGWADYSNTVSHAFKYTAADGMHDLGTLGGSRSYAFGINAAGQVVGKSEISPTSFVEHAFLWKGDGSMTDLGTATDWSQAVAINDAGLVVGTARVSGKGDHAVLWDDSVWYDLNDLVDLPSGWLLTDACDINSSGQIVALGIPYGYGFLLTPVPDPATLILFSAGVLGVLSGQPRRRRAPGRSDSRARTRPGNYPTL
jgi:probable HAF family extracellular repeat protein